MLNTTSYVPSEKWLNLTHLDTFIHGQFEFASVHSRKTQEHVSQANWGVSIHVERGAHVQFHDAALTCQLVLAASHATDSPGTPTCQ
jgi:hypothetical protein